MSRPDTQQQDHSTVAGVTDGRLRPLDGLRGLAALVVLFHHSLLASAPKLANAYLAHGFELERPPPPGLMPAKGSWDWLLSYTPLHLVWAGQEFVVVFFVLSGFVLSLPVASGRGLRVSSYYPARMLRLYLPVWGALLIAAALHVLISHRAVQGASWWLDIHSRPLTLSALQADASLGAKAGDWGFTSVLWSLRWEVLFSLMLPLVLLLPLRARSVSLALALLCFVSLRYGESKFTLRMPPFVLGVLLAFERERIERVVLLLSRRPPLRVIAELGVGIACVSLLTADWWSANDRQSAMLVATGACLALIAALSVRSFQKLLGSRPMQWTGKRAFSLYLVHEPLIVALAFALGGRVAPLPFLLLASLASLGATALFFAAIELPSHRLARRVGAGCGSAWSSLAAHLPARSRPPGALAERQAQ